MAILPITKLGNPILRAKSRDLDLEEISSDDTRRLIKNMIETMHEANGIGIAAPQVNVDAQVAIINYKDKPFAIINPRIIKKSIKKEAAEEGCLSIPGVFGIVKRHHEITVEFVDSNGQQIRQHASGLLARVFQHEIDHLNGILFIDRASKITEGQLPQ